VSSPPTTFDPRGLLGVFDRHRVAYIIVGAFGRVVQGADEITRGVDIVPSMREDNLRRLDAALTGLGAQGPNGDQPSLADSDRKQPEPVLELSTDYGELKIIPEPTGTGGYEDLRRAATREHIGQGLRPQVASLGDLTRMISSLGREQDLPKVLDLRRLAELEISHGIEI
jgi:hypothetical protein